MAFWSVDDTYVSPPQFTTTAEADEYLSLDATALLVESVAPSDPETTLFRIVDDGADAAVALDEEDVPIVIGNTVVQRVRGLTAGTDYKLRVTFLTGGANRRPMTLAIRCVE